jgi:hypothetical protein
VNLCAGASVAILAIRTGRLWRRYPITQPQKSMPRRRDGPPRAAQERKVKDDHRVRDLKARFEHVMGPQVAIEDPCLGSNELMLNLDPSVAWGRDQSWLPEPLIKLDDREPGERAKAACER